jgi:hypothetical protein
MPAPIEESKARLVRGEPGNYGRHITVRMIQRGEPCTTCSPSVAVASGDAVETGVADARTWCRADGLLGVAVIPEGAPPSAWPT